MGASFRAELLKLQKRPAIWILVLLVVAFILLIQYAVTYIGFLQAKAGAVMPDAPLDVMLRRALPHTLIRTVLENFPLPAGGIACVLGALVAGSEYGWGTLKTAFMQHPPRLAVYGGKVLAVAVVLTVLVCAVFATAAGASLLIASRERVAILWPPRMEIMQSLGAAWLIVMMWASFGLLLGTFFRGTAFAVGFGLIWMLLVESIVGDVATGIVEGLEPFARAMPGRNAASLMLSFIPGVAMTAQVSGVQAMWVLVGYTSAFLALGALLLRTRDVA